MLQKWHYPYQKQHLTEMVPNKNDTSEKMTSHKNGISKLTVFVFWSTTDNLLIEPTTTIRQKLKKLDFQIRWPWVSIIY